MNIGSRMSCAPYQGGVAPKGRKPELLNRRLNEALICNEKQKRFQSEKPLQPLSAKGLE